MRARALLALGVALALAGCLGGGEGVPPDARTPYVSPDAPPPPGSRAADFTLAPDERLVIDLPNPAVDPRHAYTLPELVDIAESANPVTAAAWQRARQAAAGVGVARAAYLPVLTAGALAGYQRVGAIDPGVAASVGGPVPISVSATSNDVVTTSASEFAAMAGASWLLLDFGGRDATLAAAREVLRAADVEFDGAHQKLILEVALAFYQTSAARAQLAIAGETRANARFLLDAATARRARGVATEIEVAQARQLLAQAELGLVQSQGFERDAYRSLLAAMGVAPTLRVKVEDVAERPLPRLLAPKLERLVDAALRRRPDVQAAFARLAADQHNVERAQSDFLPRVALTGSVSQAVGNVAVHDATLDATTRAPVNAPNADVMLALTVPIFDGGLRDAQLQAADAQAKAAAHELTQLENVGARQIVAAYDTLRTSLSAFAAASELTRAARITAEAARASYEKGLTTLTDATSAQTGLLQARLARAKAHADALSAAATLAFATGTLGAADRLGR